jgi:hypothetical protein
MSILQALPAAEFRLSDPERLRRNRRGGVSRG